MGCPKCGSNRLPQNKGTIKGEKRLLCRDCGSYWPRSSKLNSWLSVNLLKHGEGYVRNSYSAFVTDCGSICNQEAYLAELRKIIGNIPGRSSEVSTVSESLDYHNIDTTRLEVNKVTVNSWGSPDNENKQVKLTLTPKKFLSSAEIAEDFRKELSTFTPPIMPSVVKPSGSYMLEMNIPDAHFGQLSWGEETGRGDWDIKIAAECYLETVARMLEWGKSRPVEKILFPIGHDFFNSDSLTNTTTSGTPMDEDTRWMKTFSAGWKLVRDAVILASSLAPVDVVCIRGNHDLQRAFYMAEVLSSWFKDHDGVTVDNSPRMYKMREYGKNLIGLTHGQGCKQDKLPGIMASDWPEEWGRTRFREWHIGHFHQDNVKEFAGCKVRTIQSIVSASEWSATMGMRSQRGADAFLWHKEYGPSENFHYSPLTT